MHFSLPVGRCLPVFLPFTHRFCRAIHSTTSQQQQRMSKAFTLPPALPCPTLQVANVSAEDAQRNFKKALEKGLLKILSKMGISLLSCYHGAQVGAVLGRGGLYGWVGGRAGDAGGQFVCPLLAAL